MIDRFKGKKRAPSDLGLGNTERLMELARSYKNSLFVDLGVRYGYSSEAMLASADERQNLVEGVDISSQLLPDSIRLNPRFSMTCGDSSTTGKYWNPHRPVSILFVDSIHVREQVLSELYFWWPHLRPGSTIVFHDSHWPAGDREFIDGEHWGRVDDAICQFFGLNELMDIETTRFSVRCFPESYGMTFLSLKSEFDPRDTIGDWPAIFLKRDQIIRTYSSATDVCALGIELPMTLQW